jgi:hypothetical protein
MRYTGADGFAFWQGRAHRDGGGDSQHNGGFAVTGIALDNRDFAVWDIRIPQPFDFHGLELIHPNELQGFLLQDRNLLKR